MNLPNLLCVSTFWCDWKLKRAIPVEKILKWRKKKIIYCTEILISLIQMKLHEDQFPFLHILGSFDNHSMFLQVQVQGEKNGHCLLYGCKY